MLIFQISFFGTFDNVGGTPVRIMPNVIKGNVLYHSVAYNNFRNEYFVVFDVDQNNDNKADRVYGYRVNSRGVILNRQVIDFTLGGSSSKPKILVIHFETIRIVIKSSKTKQNHRKYYSIIGFQYKRTLV